MRTVVKMSLETLPSELLIEILQYLPLNTLLNGLALVSTQFYYLVQDELLRLKIDMEIDGDTYQTPSSASLSNILLSGKSLEFWFLMSKKCLMISEQVGN